MNLSITLSRRTLLTIIGISFQLVVGFAVAFGGALFFHQGESRAFFVMATLYVTVQSLLILRLLAAIFIAWLVAKLITSKSRAVWTTLGCNGLLMLICLAPCFAFSG